MSTKTKVALWVAGGLAVIAAVYQVYAYATLPSSTSTRSASAGRVVTAGTALDRCDEKVHDQPLSGSLADINIHGCHIRWNQYPANGCMNIYNRSKDFLAEDCGGFVDLTKQSPAFFQASEKQPVRVTYVLCKKRGTTNDVVDGCP
ncbi:MAG: hypothetical protein Q7R71_01275 [bacterium]|nr:hypothetical protein [bacterium]